ncbi:MAG: hypothetical protein ACHQVS_02815 [Candidatus Babeliales bacterium]
MKSILKQVLTVVLLLSVPAVFAEDVSRFARVKNAASQAATSVKTAAVNAKNAAKAQVFKHLWKKDSRLSVNVARTGVVAAVVVGAGVLTYKGIQMLRNYLRTPAATVEANAKKDGMFTRFRNWMTAKSATSAAVAPTAATAKTAEQIKAEQEQIEKDARHALEQLQAKEAAAQQRQTAEAARVKAAKKAELTAQLNGLRNTQVVSRNEKRIMAGHIANVEAQITALQ